MQTMVDAKSSGFLTGLLAERVRRELNSAFAREFAFWADGLPIVGDGPMGGEDGRHQVAGRLSLALRHPGPQLLSASEDSRVLAVPISQNGAVVAVAVATFGESESPARLLQTAQLVLDKIQTQDEVERLRRQNEEHLIQATQDLEELTFLRSIAGHLEVTDTKSDMWSLARRVLPALRHSIRAERLLLVGAQMEGDDQVVPSRPLLQFGESPLPEDGCLRLIEKLQAQADNQTLVSNRVRITEPAACAMVRNLVLVPLKKAGGALGWLLAINRGDIDPNDDTRWALSQHEFGTSEASLVESAASILTTYQVNVQLLRDKENLVANVVRTLVSTIEAKDNYTRGHSERVALFAKCLGREMGLSQKACEELYLTGLVHDVGKIGVSDAILKKVSALTDAEFEEIKKHPDDGWAILRDLHQLTYVLPGVLHHHERYDGRGYPDQLAGEEIPLEGRILAVADAYDAMTSDRAYRDERSPDEAEAVLLDGSGTQWDPQVIDAFFRVKSEIRDLRRRYRPKSKPRRQPRMLEPVAEGTPCHA